MLPRLSWKWPTWILSMCLGFGLDMFLALNEVSSAHNPVRVQMFELNIWK